MSSIFNSFQEKGILNIRTIELFFEPLFKARDLKMDITMKELYEFTGIDIHMFATEFNATVLLDISWKTHPDWTVIESIYSSCCLPFLFKPYYKEDKIYYDGGVFCNYPLVQCYHNEKLENTDEIFGIKTTDRTEFVLDEKTSLFEYGASIIKKIISKVIEKENLVVKNEIPIYSNYVSLYDIYLAVSNIDNRIQLINEGQESWKQFLEMITSRPPLETLSFNRTNINGGSISNG